jgi:hypothetical protein
MNSLHLKKARWSRFDSSYDFGQPHPTGATGFFPVKAGARAVSPRMCRDGEIFRAAGIFRRRGELALTGMMNADLLSDRAHTVDR